MAARANTLAAAAVLALGGAGVAFASAAERPDSRAAASALRATVTDGSLKLSASSVRAGKTVIVAVNAGKKTHAVAIMGAGLTPKRTPVLAPGRRASLTVVLPEGMFMVWDPVRGSMSKSVMLMVRPPSSATGGTSTGGTVTMPPITTTTPTMTDMDGGMDGC